MNIIEDNFRNKVSEVLGNYLWEPNNIDTRRRMTEELQHYAFEANEKVVDRSTPELIDAGQYLFMVQMADGREITFAEYEALKNPIGFDVNESLNS
jgi:hypothetical protein